MPFVRSFLIDPGDTILNDVNSINIIRLLPQSVPVGLLLNTVGIVGEFVKGTFNSPTLEGSYSSIKNDFGGYSPYIGDGDISANGNGIVYLAGMTWGNVVVTRVNTEVGSVTFTLSAALASNLLIPAGTRVKASTTSDVYITDQDLTIAAGATTGTVGISPANAATYTDLAAAINTVVDVPLGLGSVTLSVSNAAATSALNISTAYLNAIALLNVTNDGSPASMVNILFSARKDPAASLPTSPTGPVEPIRNALINSAVYFTNNGGGARYAVTSVPRGIITDTALLNAKQASQNAYGENCEREFFEALCVKWTCPETQTIFEITPDCFMASILSQLAPWENPAQATPYTAGILGLESDITTPFAVNDYVTFEANGINAFIIDKQLGPVFDQGFTGVNSTTYPSLKRISRLRMEDYISLTLALGIAQFGKHLSTPANQDAITSLCVGFLVQLQSPNNPNTSHIAGFSVDPKSFNTVTSLAAGEFKVGIMVQTYPSLDSISLYVDVGEYVTVTPQNSLA